MVYPVICGSARVARKVNVICHPSFPPRSVLAIHECASRMNSKARFLPLDRDMRPLRLHTFPNLYGLFRLRIGRRFFLPSFSLHFRQRLFSFFAGDSSKFIAICVSAFSTTHGRNLAACCPAFSCSFRHAFEYCSIVPFNRKISYS